MKVECENLSERVATPKLIRDLVRDDKRRGEFMILIPGIKKLVWILPLAFVLAYAAHAAYLWHMYGPPTGFCTKCTIYWGKHRILHGNHHQVDHTPLRWSIE